MKTLDLELEYAESTTLQSLELEEIQNDLYGRLIMCEKAAFDLSVLDDGVWRARYPQE